MPNTLDGAIFYIGILGGIAVGFFVVGTIVLLMMRTRKSSVPLHQKVAVFYRDFLHMPPRQWILDLTPEECGDVLEAMQDGLTLKELDIVVARYRAYLDKVNPPIVDSRPPPPDPIPFRAAHGKRRVL